MIRLLFLVLCGISLGAAALQPVPPPNWPGPFDIQTNTKTDPVVPLNMGPLQVVLERSTLAEIRNAIGIGQVGAQGDASESVRWLCYTLSRAEPKQRLWLHSGELGGGNIIDGFSAVELSRKGKAQQGCPELPKAFLPVRLTNGLWLGSTDKAIQRTLGSSRRQGALRSYEYLGKDGDFDVSGTLVVRIEGGKARSLCVNHTTTN